MTWIYSCIFLGWIICGFDDLIGLIKKKKKLLIDNLVVNTKNEISKNFTIKFLINEFYFVKYFWVNYVVSFYPLHYISI